MLHVRGGRLVATASQLPVSIVGYDRHAAERIPDDDGVTSSVSSASSNANGMRPPYFPFKSRTFERTWEPTRIGDLAIEVVNVKTNRVMAHMYLSGPAIGIMDYQHLDGRWWTPAQGARFDDFEPREGMTWEDFVASCMAIKYSLEYRVTYLRLVAPLSDLQAAADTIAEGYMHTAVNIQTDKNVHGRCHIIGTLMTAEVAKGRKNKAGGLMLLHLQPPADRNDYAAPDFAHQLLDTSPALHPHSFLDLRAWKSEVTVTDTEPTAPTAPTAPTEAS